MCEFCTEHGEGKQWYLQMKNYSDILLHEELSASQKDVIGKTTRAESLHAHYEGFTLRAIDGMSRVQDESQEAPTSTEETTKAEPSEDEIVARWKVRSFGQVLPIEDIEKVIDIAGSITRMPCGCRYVTTGKTDKRYCFGFAVDKLGILGKFPDDASSLEVLDKGEAMRIFRKYDEEGLMHSIWTKVTPYIYSICNCDRDCLLYKDYIEMSGAPSFFRAEYICQTDWDLCTGCKSCMSQCQFAAQFYSSVLGKVYIDPTRCFGCGVCRAVCPSDAITLIPRQESAEAANVWLRDTTRRGSGV